MSNLQSRSFNGGGGHTLHAEADADGDISIHISQPTEWVYLKPASARELAQFILTKLEESSS